MFDLLLSLSRLQAPTLLLVEQTHRDLQEQPGLQLQEVSLHDLSFYSGSLSYFSPKKLINKNLRTC